MKNIPYHYCFCGYRYVSSLCLWHRLTGFIMQMNHCSTRHNPNEFGLCSRLHRVSKGISLWLDRVFLALRSNAWRKRPIELWYFCLNTFWKADVHVTDEIPLSFSVAASSALRIELASSPLSALPIGTRAYRTGSRSSPYTHDSTMTCQAAVPRTSLSASCRCSVQPCRCQGNSRFGCRSPICFPLSQDWKRSSVWHSPVCPIVGIADCFLLG